MRQRWVEQSLSPLQKNSRLYHQVGGWHPSRSAVVEWQTPAGASVAFYKAGDNRDYDLYFHPEDLAPPGAGFDAQALRYSCARFDHFVAASSGSRERTRAISGCEATRLAGPALRDLALGCSLQEVADWILEYLQEDASVPRLLGRRLLPGN